VIPGYKPYKYKVPKKPRVIPVSKSEPIREGEVLAGVVDDGTGAQPASDLEERFAIALRSSASVDSFEFRRAYINGRNLPGEKELDFGVWSHGILFPIQIDGEFAHKTENQKADDELSDIMIDEALQGTNAFKVKRISGTYLQTVPDAKKIVKEIIG
jgi:hypothetical protein